MSSKKDTPIALKAQSPSPHVLEVLGAASELPICATCATQYPAPRDDCPICEDPRQWVPDQGQEWTTHGELLKTRSNDLLRDRDDERVYMLRTSPGFGINQTPFVLQTAAGSVIWDCAAVLTPHLASWLLSLERPLKAIAISHPHFFSTSLMWSRALKVPLYINGTDKEWYQRRGDIGEDDEVDFWAGRKQLLPTVQLLQCGGHFPGSAVLHWDRDAEPDAPKHAQKGALLLTADTIMVLASRKGFTFIWSAPNWIPLEPEAVARIRSVLRENKISFSQASSTWPDRAIRQNADKVFDKSVDYYLKKVGWREEGDKLVPLK